VRAAIVGAVRAEPGLTRAELQRDLGLADGQADHHLRRLVQAGFLVKVERNGQRLLYLAGAAAPAASHVADDIRARLVAGEPLTAREAALAVGTTPQLARYYLEKLVRDGAATVDADGRRRTYRAR
jgi:predicted ArsR family transcriptional regulator